MTISATGQKIKPLLQKYRLSVIALFVLMGISWLDLMYGIDYLANPLFGLSEYNKNIEKLYPFFGIMVVFALFLNKYLSSEDSFSDRKSIIVKDNLVNDKFNKTLASLEKKFEQEIYNIKASLELLREESIQKTSDSFSQEHREQIIKALKQQLTTASTSELLEDLKSQTKRIIESDTRERLKYHFVGTKDRLTEEIKALGKRSKVNLIMGSLAAFAGVSIFMLFVFENVGDSSAQTYLAKEFAPRISLVVVIEIFAYFFLGLYKNNLSEIKHFHNEITNVEQKYVALEEAIASSDKDTIKELVRDIAKTERNFLLKKGESTVSLEERRVVLEEQAGIINSLLNKIGNSTR